MVGDNTIKVSLEERCQSEVAKEILELADYYYHQETRLGRFYIGIKELMGGYKFREDESNRR